MLFTIKHCFLYCSLFPPKNHVSPISFSRLLTQTLSPLNVLLKPMVLVSIFRSSNTYEIQLLYWKDHKILLIHEWIAVKKSKLLIKPNFTSSDFLSEKINSKLSPVMQTYSSCVPGLMEGWGPKGVQAQPGGRQKKVFALCPAWL